MYDRARKVPPPKLGARFVSQKQAPSEKRDDIVKKIKEMKRNLRLQQTTLAHDVERDAEREERATTTTTNVTKREPTRPPRRHRTSPSGGANQRKVDSVNNSESGRSSTKTVTPPGEQTNPVAVVQGMAAGVQPYGLPVHPGSLPIHPGSLPVHPAGVLPFQYQLQHDPRTGYFQMVPVAISQNVAGGNLSPSSPSAMSPGVHVMPLQMPGGLMMGQYGALQTSDGSERGEKKQRSKHRERVKRRDSHHRRCEVSDCEKCGDRETRAAPCRHTHTEQDISPRSVARSDSARYPSIDGQDPRGHANDRLGRYEHTTNYDHVTGGNSRPMRPRQVKAKDSRSKLKRAKSGSSLDYRHSASGEAPPDEYENSCHCDHGNKNGPSSASSRQLYKSQPDLNHNLITHDDRGARRLLRQHTSPDLVPSPSLSPSWSKDSGVSGLNLKGSGDATLMERLLNSETIRHQQRLSRVIRLLREEFAYDGYMENGGEDLVMGE